MWPYPRALAHRGGGALAPENTIAALRCGLAHGYRAVEFDVMLAADGVPVVVHDPEFGRTVAGSGRVADHTAAELAGMDAGSWFGPDFAGEPVPSYEEVFRFCLANRIWMNVEIKPAPGFEAVTGRTVAALTAQWLQGPAAMQALSSGWQAPLLSSFSHEALLAARMQAPALKRACLFDTIPANWRELLQQIDAQALHANYRNLTPALAAEVRQAGYGLFCYTVNDPERLRTILSWGVEAFCTDRIDLIHADFA